MDFVDRKVSVNRAIVMLAKNGIDVDDSEATVILDFLYFISKNCNEPEEEKDVGTLKRNQTSEKYD
ncbi:hypothetical protein Flavo103_44330 [Flavobacterium collinsii]|uniref:PTS sugar transporter subunit IIBC n=1 Tax=Flavobacterium collinsii TaxID=1114861 RepID=UPI0022CCF3CD|nr:PTS sugar transporter subunit IIBC [Flavobacterium collinsii]GIQ61298.1 hypothetical protein Flavo103_44330 [Flavobacterium collinsii]